jgi:hypothetical protein
MSPSVIQNIFRSENNPCYLTNDLKSNSQKPIVRKKPFED